MQDASPPLPVPIFWDWITSSFAATTRTFSWHSMASSPSTPLPPSTAPPNHPPRVHPPSSRTSALFRWSQVQVAAPPSSPHPPWDESQSSSALLAARARPAASPNPLRPGEKSPGRLLVAWRFGKHFFRGTFLCTGGCRRRGSRDRARSGGRRERWRTCRKGGQGAFPNGNERAFP